MRLARHLAVRASGFACAGLLCALALAAAALASRPRLEGVQGGSFAKLSGHASATLERCGIVQSGQAPSATYAATMRALPGSARMQMRFEVFVRGLGETSYHRATSAGASGGGRWRDSEAGVTIFKGFDEVLNLMARSAYQARVRFRWLDRDGHVLHWTRRRTIACRPPFGEPAPASGPVSRLVSSARSRLVLTASKMGRR